MALRGTLKDFGIAEIFQLIGGQGKSGTLYLEAKKSKLTLLFERGAIVGVELGRERSSLVAELVVRAGLVTREQLREVKALQKKTQRSIEELLSAQGLVQPQVLDELIGLVTNEALYGLFSWQDGTYRFEAGDVPVDSARARARSLEQLVMEGFRRIDEWPMIERRIGSRDATFEVVALLPPSDSDNEDIGPAERRVFSFCSPENDVQRIIDLTRMGDFEACRALGHLLDLGYLRPASKTRARRRAQVVGPRWRARLGSASAVKGVIAITAVALLVLLVSFLQPEVSSFLRAPTEGTVGGAEPRALLGSAALARLREAVQIYTLERGQAPAKLDDLLAAELISPEELRYPWDVEYVYTPPGTRPRGMPLDAPPLPVADLRRPLR